MEKRVESKTRLRAKNPKTTTGGEKLEKVNARVSVYIHRISTDTFLRLGETFPQGEYSADNDWFACTFPNRVEITWFPE
jgi:hypothetical protein